MISTLAIKANSIRIGVFIFALVWQLSMEASVSVDSVAQPQVNNTSSEAYRLRVAINSEIKFKADLRIDKRAAASLTHNFTVYELTIDELAEKLRERCNIASVCLAKNGRFHRRAEYFKSAFVIGVDVDNDKEITVIGEEGKKKKIKVKCEGDEYLTIEQALNHPLVKKYGGIVYTTASHKPDHHKFRILFIFSAELTDRAQFEKIVRALIWIFKSDDSCKDASRFYYGTGENGQVIVIGKRLTDDGIAEVLAAYDDAHAPQDEWKAQRDADDEGIGARNNDLTDASERRAMYGRWAIGNAVRLIDESVGPCGGVSGNRHKARLRAARLLGGYVKGGLLNYSEVRTALAAVVQRNTDDFTSAMKTIDDGLEYGQSAPITFEDKEREREAYLRQKASSQSSQVSDEKRRAAEVLRAAIAAANGQAQDATAPASLSERELSETQDVFNFIYSRARTPDNVQRFVNAAIGAAQENTRPGQESDQFEVRDLEMGLRLRATNNEVKRASIKKTASRYRHACDEWQAKNGYVFVESEDGGRSIAENGEEVYCSTRYRVPILSVAFEQITQMRASSIYSSNPSSAIRQYSKRAARLLKITPNKQDRFRRRKQDPDSIIRSNHKLILTKLEKNLNLIAANENSVADDPVEYVELLRDAAVGLLGQMGFKVMLEKIEATATEKAVVHTKKKINTGQRKSAADDTVSVELWKRFEQRIQSKKRDSAILDKTVHPPQATQTIETTAVNSNSAKTDLKKQKSQVLKNQRLANKDENKKTEKPVLEISPVNSAKCSDELVPEVEASPLSAEELAEQMDDVMASILAREDNAA